MAGPASVELLSFRRTFTRLILLVVLPSAGLLGFGIVGIVNERAAVEKRIELLWTGRLGNARTELAAALAEAQVKSTSPTLVLARGELQLTDVGFAVTNGEVQSEDSRIAAALKPLGPDLASLPERPVVFSVSSPQGTFLVVALRQGERVIGAQVSVKAVETLLADHRGQADAAGRRGPLPAGAGQARRAAGRHGGATDRGARGGPGAARAGRGAAALAAAGLPPGGGGDGRRPGGGRVYAQPVDLQRAARFLLHHARAGSHLHRENALPRGPAVTAEDRLRVPGEP